MRQGRRSDGCGRPIVTAAILLSALGSLSCDGPDPATEVRRSALVGDPIESIQRIQGHAPLVLNTTESRPGTIDSASFTIGLFDEDAASCAAPVTVSRGDFGPAQCNIMAEIDPEQRGRDPIVGWPLAYSLPPLDDVSVVAVTVNVGAATKMQWDWHYNAYYEDPINAFWVEVVDQNGVPTAVGARVSAPDDWGYNLWQPSLGAHIVWSTTPATVELDLTPWRNQQISVRFSLRNNYIPTYLNRFCYAHAAPEGGSESCDGLNGAWDLPVAKVYVDNLRVDYCSVTKLELQEIASSLDTNGGPGGGLRIFPDKETPGDTTDRSTVCVVATTTHPDCPVTFRVLDVDDPSSDTAPVDLNGPDGDDNDRRGTAVLTSTPACAQTAKSGADGLARTALQVSKFPGDNFVVVAGVNANDVAGVKTTGAKVSDASDADLPTKKVQRTPMLTVWRRLHIERDSMGAVAGNHASGRILSVAPIPEIPGTIRLRVDATLDLRRFEHGHLVVGDRSLVVDSNTVNSIWIVGDMRDLVRLRGLPFTLYDDDDFNGNDRALRRGDEGEDIPMPSDRLLGDSDLPEYNVLAPAYVRPAYDLAGDDNVPFALNLDDYEELTVQDSFRFDQASPNDSDYWALYLLGGYQGTVDRSHDPDDSAATLGVVDSVGGRGGLVFVEPLRELGETATRNVATVAAHEIGHLLCLNHGEGGLMGNDAEGVISDFVLHPPSIATVRRADRWYAACQGVGHE